MKSFFKKLITRVLTFIVIMFLSILFLLEFSIQTVIFSLIYLFIGKQFELCPVTRAIAGAFNDFEYVEAVF